MVLYVKIFAYKKRSWLSDARIVVSHISLDGKNSAQLNYSSIRSLAGKLSGMNEHSAELDLSGKKVDSRSLATCVLQTANLLVVPSSDPNSQRFAGRSVANESPVLVSLDGPPPAVRLCINCESMTIGSMLLKELKEAIGRAFWDRR